MMKQISIIVCDDHPIFRQGLITTLEKDSSIIMLGECGDGETALKLIIDKKPDIAVLDIAMPGIDGLHVVRTVNNQQLSTKCIILTMYKEEEYFNEAMDAGVLGYLLKENASADLIACIKTVSDGHYYVSSLLSDFLIEREYRIKTIMQERPALVSLTETERKILHLVAENKTSKEIANVLFISHRTVQNHRQHISNKLNLHGPHALLKFALDHKSLF